MLRRTLWQRFWRWVYQPPRSSFPPPSHPARMTVYRTQREARTNHRKGKP